jgi:hypothetical protein
MVFQLARDQDEVRTLCPGMKFNLGVALGCSRAIMGMCLMVKVTDADIKAAAPDSASIPAPHWSRPCRAQAERGAPAFAPGRCETTVLAAFGPGYGSQPISEGASGGYSSLNPLWFFRISADGFLKCG